MSRSKKDSHLDRTSLKKIKNRIKNLIASLFSPITRNRTFTIRYGLGKGFKIQVGLSFLRYHPTLGLSPEERFLSNLDYENKIIYDIGAYHGILTMYFARAVGKNGSVISFEPNYQSFLIIQKNIKLNKMTNIKVFNLALGEQKDTRKMVFNPYFSATGNMVKEIQLKMMEEDNALETTEVKIDTLDNLFEIEGLTKPDFIKIDVEGMEIYTLLGMVNILNNYHPSLFIEIHGATFKSKIKNIQKITELVQSCGYRIFHVETGQYINKNNYEIAKEGHIFCTHPTRS